jgi:hypothetical protein
LKPNRDAGDTPIVTNEARTSAVVAFWKAFDQAWQAGGARSAEAACTRLQEQSNYTLAPATVRGWLNHTRLPRKDDDVEEMFLLLVGKGPTDELMTKLRRARASRDRKPSTTPPPPVASDGFWRRKVWGRARVWHLGVAALLVPGAAAGTVLVTAANDQAPVNAATVLSTVAGDEPLDAEIPPCPSDAIEVVSKKERARAEFCPDRSEFLLYDQKSDKKSAILVVRRNGHELPAWFNSDGHAKRSADGSQIVLLPPKRVPVQVEPEDSAEFRVCFGDRNDERNYPPQTCSEWTPFSARS